MSEIHYTHDITPIYRSMKYALSDLISRKLKIGDIVYVKNGCKVEVFCIVEYGISKTPTFALCNILDIFI